MIRQGFAHEVAAAIVDVRRELQLTPESGSSFLEAEWNLVSPSQVLFVIIREEDFKEHYRRWVIQYARNERPIRARLHEAGNVGALLNQRADYAFDPAEFRDNPVIKLKNPGGHSCGRHTT